MKNHVAGKDQRRRRFRREAVLTESELVEQELARMIGSAREVALAGAAEFDRLVSGSASKGLRARPGYEDVLGYMASWCRYVQLGVAAQHRMEDAGDHFFAAPLRRSLLEHGVAMWTLAQDPGVHHAFVRAHQHSVRKMQGAMSDVGLDHTRTQRRFWPGRPIPRRSHSIGCSTPSTVSSSSANLVPAFMCSGCRRPHCHILDFQLR